ncbi:MAG: hypothetical protein KKF78_06870 [Candidatus Omnitrophica bacterium]|nr:hypothetical protein [Candidatus Omnitrophota bacterium]MBU1996860.1 hypothetical protein [Candidatus Omnitrophota bacterium]
MFRKWFLIFVSVLISFHFMIGNATAANDKVLFDKANSYLEVGQKEFAIMSFREIIRDYPSSIYCDESSFRLGEYYYKQSNPNEANRILSQHSKMYPDSPFKDQANEYLKKLNSVILIKKANELFAENRWEEALVVYTKLIEENPKLGSSINEKIDKCNWKIAENKREIERRKARIDSGSLEAELLAQDIQSGKAQSSVKVMQSKSGTSSSLKSVLGQATAAISSKTPIDDQMKSMERKFNLSMRSNDGNVPAAMLAIMGPFVLVILSIMFVLYVYSAFCLQTIARKTDTEGSWLAWVPIFNVILMCDIARKPKWWFFLIFLTVIPIIGSIIVLVLFVVIWMNICEQCGKPNWLGVLTVIPFVSLVLLGYLALSKVKRVKQKENKIERIDDLPPPPAPIKF